MHRCLRLEELLLRIFGILDKNTLTVLARTCRAFTGPALDVLYRSITIGALVKCLPAEVWSTTSGPDTAPSTMDIVRPLNNVDWSNFINHSTRVRHLNMYDTSGYIQVIKMLLDAPIDIDIFPNLRTLSLSLLPSSDNPVDEGIISLGCRFVPWILKSTLTALVLGLPTPVLKAVFDELPLEEICPFLHLLDVCAIPSDGGSPAEMPESLDRAIRSLSSLHHLACHAVSSRTLQHIASLKNLHTLGLWLSENSHPVDVFLPMQEQDMVPFGRLRNLTLRSQRIQEICTFLNTIDWDIAQLSLAITSVLSLSSVQALFSTLPSKLRTTTLEHFQISMALGDDEPVDPPVIGLESIRALFVFSRLMSLSLKLQCIIDIDNSMLARMAQAWPYLRTLVIEQHEGHFAPPNITLPGLVPLLGCCRFLETFSLPINATFVPTDPSRVPGDGVVNYRITEICVHDSPIMSPGFVAAFLSGILPELTKIDSWLPSQHRQMGGAVGDIYRDRWNLTAELVPIFSTVRVQERLATVLRYRGWDEDQDDEDRDDEDRGDEDQELEPTIEDACEDSGGDESLDRLG
ncbi:hypothetical protein F5I97DRAFT_115675 [Phlebopus sp. FC_14]|nr:hypothetical protein F5I97DRAFT_115675 [Phlebopus sp. FC_14]